MAEPRIHWQGQKLYFHDAAGGVWRVYDCTYVAHRSRAVPLSDPRAVHRSFVRGDGTRRILRFDGASARAISARVLARQLAASEQAPAEGGPLPTDAPGAEAS
jgi:hypothetical protein